MTKHRHDHVMGSGGECICPKCHTIVPHKRGTPCQEVRCTKCGAKLLRVGSRHHELWLKKNSP